MENYKENSRGVTVIEMIVVLAVFFIIMSVVVSIFISIVKNQRRTLDDQEILNQSNYVAEYMSRTIRDAVKDGSGNCISAGLDYSLTHHDGASNSYQGIKFLGRDGICREFFLDSDGIFKEIKDGGTAQALMSDRFVVPYARFIINGDKTKSSASEPDAVQPRITFSMDVKNKTASPVQERIVQTTVSQGDLNLSE